MKSLLFSFFFLLFAMAINAQSQTNTYKKRGKVYFSAQQLNDFELGTASDTNVWVIRNADLSEKRIRIKYIANPTDSIIHTKSMLGNMYRYSAYSRDTLAQIGYENNLTKVHYSHPIILTPYPNVLGYSFQGSFYGSGVYCEKSNLKEFGRYSITLSAEGQLVLPEGDTIQNVRCYSIKKDYISVYSELTSDMEKENEDTISGYALDSVLTAMFSQSTPQKDEILLWYADGYAYPIIEGHLIKRYGIRERNSETDFFYIPLSEQEYDEELAQRQQEESRLSNMNNGSFGSRSIGRGRDIGSGIITRNSNQEYSIEMLLSEASHVSYKIYNALGICIQEVDRGVAPAGMFHDTYQLEKYQQGTYILAVILNGQTVNSIKINSI